MSTHKIRAIVGLWIPEPGGEDRVSVYPELEITYSFTPGYPETRIDPASPDELEVISVKIIDDDGLGLDDAKACEIAEAWLDGDGRADALENIPDGPDPDDARDAEIDRRLCEAA